MRAQVIPSLATVALATLAAGVNVPKVSLSNSWNSTSSVFQKGPTVTITDMVKLPAETVYVTVTVAPEPTVGCIAPLPPGNNNGGETNGEADSGITSSETGVTVIQTQYFTVTETVPVAAIPKTSDPAPEATTVITDPVSESTTTESTTAIILTSTFTNVITLSAPEVSVKAPSSSKASTLRFTGIGPNGWNVTLPTVPNAAAPISASSVQYHPGSWSFHHKAPLHTAAPVTKRQIGGTKALEWVTATINGVVVSWETTYNHETPTATIKASVTFPGSPIPTTPTATIRASVTFPGSSSTPVGSTPTPTPSDCGEIGNFTINFDHLPSYSPPPGNDSVFPPIFSPCYHFLFSEGWTYGKSYEGFVPVSAPHMAIFQSETEDDPDMPEDLKNGAQFSVGPRLADSKFWFNVYSLSFGCPGNLTDVPCEVSVSGFKYSPQAGAEYKAHVQVIEIPTCAIEQSCNLTTINLDDEFRGLTSILFNATTRGATNDWVLDDLNLDWYDNSCGAGWLRSHFM